MLATPDVRVRATSLEALIAAGDDEVDYASIAKADREVGIREMAVRAGFRISGWVAAALLTACVGYLGAVSPAGTIYVTHNWIVLPAVACADVEHAIRAEHHQAAVVIGEGFVD